MQHRHRNSAGFTLLEVILAISILSVMVALSYRVITGIIEAKRLLDDQRDGMFIADAVLTRLSRELQLTANKRPLLPACDSVTTSTGNTGSSSNPAATMPSLYLLGEEKQLGMNLRGDSLTFVAREAGQYIPDGGTHSGVVQITYRVAPDPDQANSRDATYLLVRDEIPYRRPVDRACQAALHFPITKNLVGLEFMYLDKRTNQWTTSWGDDKMGRLPQVIQFKLTLSTPGGQLQTLTSAVALRAAN